MVLRYCGNPSVALLKLNCEGWSTWMCSSASTWKNTENQRLKPMPKPGTVCSTVILPGIRENLFAPIERSTAPGGRVSPVSSGNRPGLPSRAGIGTYLGTCSELSSGRNPCGGAGGFAGFAVGLGSVGGADAVAASDFEPGVELLSAAG